MKTVTGQAGVGVGIGVGVEVGVGVDVGRGVRVGVGVKSGIAGSLQAAKRGMAMPKMMNKAIHPRRYFAVL